MRPPAVMGRVSAVCVSAVMHGGMVPPTVYRAVQVLMLRAAVLTVMCHVPVVGSALAVLLKVFRRPVQVPQMSAVVHMRAVVMPPML